MAATSRLESLMAFGLSTVRGVGNTIAAVLQALGAVGMGREGGAEERLARECEGAG